MRPRRMPIFPSPLIRLFAILPQLDWDAIRHLLAGLRASLAVIHRGASTYGLVASNRMA
jgi:hypothetical protein